MNLIPMEGKAEYITATQVSPHLFQEEVSPVAFLRSENFNPWAAARKMTMYWKARKQALGEQWLLPLAQSGYGALTNVDVQLLATGYCVIHERMAVIDWSRLTDFAGNSFYTDEELERARMRVMLYLATVTADEYSQRIGKDYIVNVSGITVGSLWKCEKIWPGNMRNVYLVVMQNRLADRLTTFWTSFLTDGFLRYFGRTPTLIIASSKADMLQKLQQVGFDADLIPEKWGGNWSYENGGLEQWMQELARRDDERNRRILLGNNGNHRATITSTSPLSTCVEETQRQHHGTQIEQTWIDYRTMKRE